MVLSITVDQTGKCLQVRQRSLNVLGCYVSIAMRFRVGNLKDCLCFGLLLMLMPVHFPRATVPSSAARSSYFSSKCALFNGLIFSFFDIENDVLPGEGGEKKANRINVKFEPPVELLLATIAFIKSLLARKVIAKSHGADQQQQ